MSLPRHRCRRPSEAGPTLACPGSSLPRRAIAGRRRHLQNCAPRRCAALSGPFRRCECLDLSFSARARGGRCLHGCSWRRGAAPENHFCPEFVVGLYVKQHLDDLGMAVRSCKHQGCPPFLCRYVYRCIVGKKVPDTL